MIRIDEKLEQSILDFFEGMCYFFDMEKTVRSGNVYVGRYGRADVPLPFLDNGIETVAGHAGGLAYMTFLFYVYFEDLRPGSFEMMTNVIYGMLFGLVHDMPEAQSEKGDQSDDRYRPDKVGFEENLLAICLAKLPEEWSEILTANHEDAEGLQSELGRRRKGIDKLYAVLRSLKFDLDGHRGDARFKEIGYQLGYFDEGLSKRDEYFANIIGSQNATEVWTAHLLWTTQKFEDYDLFWAIVCVVSEKVYGDSFWWLKDKEAIRMILAYPK